MEKCKEETFRMLQLQDVITPANRHLAKEGDFGFVSDWITEIIEMVNNHKTAAVVELQMNPDEPANIEKPFVANATKYRYFYKLESIPSEAQKAKMMQMESEDQILHLMDSADMLKAMNEQSLPSSAMGEGERGFKYSQNEYAKGCQQVVAIHEDGLEARNGAFALPYFAIEKVKEEPKGEYRPFANAEEFAPYRDRWFIDKHDSDIVRVELYCNSGITEVRGYCSYDELLNSYTFDDGTPAGVRV